MLLRKRVVSPAFVTSTSKKLRLVLDYTHVIACLEDRTFRMDQLGDLATSLPPKESLLKADISDAYYHLRIRGADQWRLEFAIDGQVYLPLCLICGLSVAPWFFTKAMRPVATHP